MIRNESVQFLLDDIFTAIRESGLVDQALGARVAQCVLEGLQQRYGGGKLYIPVDCARAQLTQAVLADYARGDAPRAICRRHAISRAMFYRLLHTQTEA